MIKHLVLKQPAENPVPTEVLATSIEAISKGIAKLRETRLNDKALVLLIQHACPNVGYPARHPSTKEVRAVLEGIESLEKTYLKPKKEQK